MQRSLLISIASFLLEYCSFVLEEIMLVKYIYKVICQRIRLHRVVHFGKHESTFKDNVLTRFYTIL